MQKLMITVALVGAEVRKEDTPYLPITPDEIAQQAQEVYEAGASMVHIHVRDQEGKATQDRELYRETIQKIRERCPIIVQVSTGGAVGMTDDERLQPVSLKPEMASLTTGTVNFGEGVLMNSAAQLRRFALELQEHGVRPEFEIFDTGMIENAYKLVRDGFVQGHLHYDFVMGVPGAMPATPEQLLFLREKIPSEATWSVAGIGRAQLPMATMAILLGGHVRVGLEDNIYYSKGVLATNRQLVERIVRISREIGREIATPDEARRILQIQ